MKKQTKFLSYIALISLTLTGCSSSDDPGNENDGPPLPADAAIIDINNARIITSKALDTFNLLANTLTEATYTSSGVPVNCITGYYTDTWTANISGISGQMDFNSCAFADPLTLSGIYNYSATISPLTSTGEANNFSLDYDGALYTLNVKFSVGLNLTTDGYIYNISTDFSLSGITDQGLLFTTVSPLSGTLGGGVESGQVVVSGANNTRLRITVINNGADVEVELDAGSGTYTESWIINIVSTSTPVPDPAPAP